MHPMCLLLPQPTLLSCLSIVAVTFYPCHRLLYWDIELQERGQDRKSMEQGDKAVGGDLGMPSLNQHPELAPRAHLHMPDRRSLKGVRLHVHTLNIP